MSEMVVYDGRQIPAIKIGEEHYVALKPIVEGMGLDWMNQFRKVTKSARYSHMTIPLDSGSGIQDTTCIPLRKLNGWLFSINAEKCREGVREKVIEYQERCFQVLYDFFQKGGAINPSADMSQLVALVNTIRDQAKENAVLALENRGLKKALKDAAPNHGTYGKISHATLEPRVEFRKSYWRSDRKKRRDDFMIQLRLAIADAMDELN